MDECIEAPFKGLVQVFRVQDVACNKIIFRKQILQKPAGQVVEHRYLVPLSHQFLYHMASDITGTANHQNLHTILLSINLSGTVVSGQV